MNDLRDLVDDATPESLPGFESVLARRDQRRRRRRAGYAAASVAVLAVATGLAVQLGARDADQTPAPAPTLAPTESPSPTPAVVDRPDPTYTWSDTPSRVVVRTPERDIELTTWLGCWRGPSGDLDCVEDKPAPVAELPDIGSPTAVDFWFGVKGWAFDATLTRLGSDCPRVEDTRTVATGAHWFRLDPAGLAGDYRVDLQGYGPHADFKGAPTNMSFVWHTSADGPVDQPKAQVSDGELQVHSLGFQPESAAAQVTITDADGTTTTRRLPPAPGADGECPMDELGALYFQGDFDDPAIPGLGPRPHRYRVRLTLDGADYVGTAGDDGRVTWSPELPAYTG